MSILKSVSQVTFYLLSFLVHFFQRRGRLDARNLFLRKQLTFYQERRIKPRSIDSASKLTLVLLLKLFNWKEALVIFRPKTLIRWHREAFYMFWQWKSRAGRPAIPGGLRASSGE